MNVYLRLEQPQEYRIVEELTREAFWGMDHPDCNEHLLVHKVAFCFCICAGAWLRSTVNGKIVGNIMR